MLPNRAAPTRWDMNELRIAMIQLGNHPGFPSGDQMECPVLLQDKVGYLKVIPELVSVTITVMLEKEYGEEDIQQLRLFWELHCTGGNKCSHKLCIITPSINHTCHSTFYHEVNVNGACLKAPFHTGGKYVKRNILTFEKLMDFLGTAFNELHPEVDHVFVQGMRKNTTEKKIVFLDGIPNQVSSKYSKQGPNIGIYPSYFKPYHPSKDKPLTHYLLLV